ncbi:glycosyltransferase [Vibrio sp. FNV 38]|nr:glycosyltransferase [Vibrio sp. FNV 38]
MKILLMSIGSRGDVEPYIALGMALLAKGHQVNLCTPCRFQSMVEAHGLTYQYISDDMFKMLEGGTLESMGSLLSGIKTTLRLIKMAKPINRSMIIDTIQAGVAVRPDLVIYHPKCLAAVSIAEKMKVPAVMAVLQPMVVKTRHFPPAGIPNVNRITNRLSYSLVSLGFRQYRSELNRQRQALLGLSKLDKGDGVISHSDGQPIPVLHAFSECLVPRPSDWPSRALITGYWSIKTNHHDYQPPQSLSAFLMNNTPIVYIGFGSMAGKNPEKTGQMVVDAVVKAGVRAIIATGWGGLKVNQLPDTILEIDSVPHDWLFPQVCAVVHHGGAGTTAAGLIAGKPTLVCPFFGDQPFWGQQIERQALGPAPIKQSKLTVDNLANALTQLVSDPQFARNARAVATTLSQEDGIGKAITWLEHQGILQTT